MFLNKVFTVSMLSLLLLSSACSSSINRAEVVAQAGRTQSSQVATANFDVIDSSIPNIAILIEPFDYAASGVTSGNTAYRAPMQTSVIGEVVGQIETELHQFPPQYGHEQIGRGIAAQLRTAFAKTSGVSVLDTRFLGLPAREIERKALESGEIGPIVIRGTVTEFNEVADMQEDGGGFNLSVLGTIAGILGAVLESDALIYSGTGVTAANPTYSSKETTRKGMVSIDLEIIDAKRGRLLDGCTVSGTFTSKSSAKGVSIFGISRGSSDFAASAIGQATRVAINRAVQKIGDSFNRRYSGRASR